MITPLKESYDQPRQHIKKQRHHFAHKGLYRQSIFFFFFLASLIAQLVKYLLAMQETPGRCLGREDPLEKETSTHSSILAWRSPWTEEPGRLEPMRLQESDMT